MAKDLVHEACVLAAKKFGGSDGMFNAANFSVALQEIVNACPNYEVIGLTDGKLVRAILAFRDDIEELGGNHYYRVRLNSFEVRPNRGGRFGVVGGMGWFLFAVCVVAAIVSYVVSKTAPDSLNVLLYKDGVMWVAIGADVDICTQGETMYECMARFQEAVALYRMIDLQEGKVPFKDHPSSPKIYRGVFERGEYINIILPTPKHNPGVRFLVKLTHEPSPYEWAMSNEGWTVRERRLRAEFEREGVTVVRSDGTKE